MKKIKTGTMLSPRIIKLCDDNLKLANTNSRNDFIEKAILFYVGYLNSNNNEYLNDVISKTLSSNISILEDRINKTLFKQETIDILRKKSIQEVKETSGKITLDNVIKNSEPSK